MWYNIIDIMLYDIILWYNNVIPGGKFRWVFQNVASRAGRTAPLGGAHCARGGDGRRSEKYDKLVKLDKSDKLDKLDKLDKFVFRHAGLDFNRPEAPNLPKRRVIDD